MAFGEGASTHWKFVAQGQGKNFDDGECRKIWMQVSFLPLPQYKWKWEVICLVFTSAGIEFVVWKIKGKQ